MKPWLSLLHHSAPHLCRQATEPKGTCLFGHTVSRKQGSVCVCVGVGGIFGGMFE